MSAYDESKTRPWAWLALLALAAIVASVVG